MDNYSNSSRYLITKTITNNITKSSLNDYLTKINKHKEFTRSGQEHETFITDLLNDGVLNINELNDYLFDALFFGKQRSCYIRKILNITEDISSIDKILQVIRRLYPNINHLPYNIIANSYFTIDDISEGLLGVKIIEKDKEIKGIRFIFGQYVELLNKKRRQFENSYVAIEINIEQALLITKVYPKTKILNDDDKPLQLALKFSTLIMNMFGIDDCNFERNIQEVLYWMSKNSFVKVYNKMVNTYSVSGLVKDISNNLASKLNISNIKQKSLNNNLFDINKSIGNYIENLLICDVLYETDKNDDYEGLEGLIAYLKFNDGKNVNARLKGKNCKDTILNSETYLSLRSTLDNCRVVAELQIWWYNQDEKFRVRYSEIENRLVEIHFYKNLQEGDFLYGLNKFKEFESRTVDEIPKLDSNYTHNMAQ
ncbi:MAG: hypothetical protein N4A49_03790 [Marinifilaceae bacterium]|jgi:hypothetical protein|nr:hypothetical protein [Marinifilaceae bacterium]